MAEPILIRDTGAIGGTLRACRNLAPLSIGRLAGFDPPTATTDSGTGRDIGAGKRETEVDARIAPITNPGDEAGAGSPTPGRLLELVYDIEQGRRVQSAETLRELADVC